MAIIAYFAGRFYFLLAAPVETKSVAPVSVTQITLPPKIDTSRIADWHLFGQEASQPVAKPEPQLQAARPSTRNYRIAGLAESSVSESSSVLFELKPGDMEFFKTGDMVEQGVKVSRIQDGSVYLEVNGRLERVDAPVNKERLLIPALARSSDSLQPSEYSWDWLESWNSLSDREVAASLGLEWVDQSWVITRNSPMIASQQIEAGFKVLGVNGRPLGSGESVKSGFQPLYEGVALYIQLQTPRKRVTVRWER